MHSPLIHHVFFWLNDPTSATDLEKLLNGLKTLEQIDTVKQLYIGVPASTEQRDVIDNSYSASELIFFDNLEGEEIYQNHPIHQEFIKNCSPLWKKVVVYDTVGA